MEGSFQLLQNYFLEVRHFKYATKNPCTSWSFLNLESETKYKDGKKKKQKKLYSRAKMKSKVPSSPKKKVK